jgi:hypothetical protein
MLILNVKIKMFSEVPRFGKAWESGGIAPQEFVISTQ